MRSRYAKNPRKAHTQLSAIQMENTIDRRVYTPKPSTFLYGSLLAGRNHNSNGIIESAPTQPTPREPVANHRNKYIRGAMSNYEFSLILKGSLALTEEIFDARFEFGLLRRRKLCRVAALSCRFGERRDAASGP